MKSGTLCGVSVDCVIARGKRDRPTNLYVKIRKISKFFLNHNHTLRIGRNKLHKIVQSLRNDKTYGTLVLTSKTTPSQ